MFKKIRKLWLSISLRKKLGAYAGAVILVLGVSVLFNVKLADYAIGGFNVILDDNSKCHELQEALEEETEAFENLIRSRSEENKEAYNVACARSERCLRFLPFRYEEIGAERYARTWNVKNGYEGYSALRDLLLAMDPNDEEYIPSLYKVYQMQSYLQGYARRLLQTTMQEGDASYRRQVPIFANMPWMILLFSAGMMAVVVMVTNLMSHAFLDPLAKLVGSTRKIAVNDFSGEDLVVENEDEMGEMVKAFNKMKHATEGYISTLMNSYEMSELLHKEEIERVETEKRLDAARLELLKNQINPHFLFNTLNTIACMAKLEDAATTERMITSMSNLFRYNLKTAEQAVPLEQELKVVQDYMYIQKMRFGSRIGYESDIQVDASQVIIPAFTLQPLAENGIVHGISKKEQGGRVHVRAWMDDGMLVLSVADTGVGMSEERLAELREALQSSRTSKVGIGLGNIYQRIRTMYPDGDFRLYSKVGSGTVIQMRIPQKGGT